MSHSKIFFSPFTSLSLTTHCRADSGAVSSRHGCRQWRCARAPGTRNPRQPSSIRKHHILHSLLQRFLLKSSHLSLTSTFATSNLLPHGTFLLYCNNLFAFPRLSSLLYAAWEKKPSTFPFQILISLSGAFCKKSPMRMLLLLLLYIFILPFYTQQNAGPPPCHLFSPLASTSFQF